jgi:uncharacterized membrane protein
MSARANHIESQRVPSGRLWFGFVAAALAWLIQGFLSVVISASACQNGAYQWRWISEGGVRVLLAVITIALLAVAVAALVVSFRNWRGLSTRRELTHAEGKRREEFMALGGVFASAAFVIGIIWGGIPLILISICRSAR